MFDQVTKSDVINLENQLDKRFDELAALMSGFANDVQVKLSDHDDEFRKLNEKYDHLLSTIDGFIGRIDNYETELVARDHKIERLERWIQEIAAKANISLT
jgi:hypothetical protein